MTIGPDIKEAIVEVGTKVSIIIDTKPFIREFFLEGTMQYDTQAVSGDIVQFDTTGTKYLVSHITPTLFENEVIRYEVVLYKANMDVTILRPVEVRDPVSYLTRTYWSTVKSSASLVLTTPLFGQSLEGDQELGLLGIETHEVYAPSSYGITYLDRIRTAGSYWRVEAVRKYRYEGVDVIDVGEDVRPTSTTTTTTTTTTYPHYYDVEMIENGDMETGQGNPWRPDGWATAGVEVGESLQSSSEFHSPGNSLHLNTSLGDEGVRTNIGFTIYGGATYQLSLWAKRVSGNIYVWCMNYEQDVRSEFVLSGGYSNWAQFITTFSWPTTEYNSNLWIRSSGGGAEWYVDDVSLKEISV
jgi:hypothetical protein